MTFEEMLIASHSSVISRTVHFFGPKARKGIRMCIAIRDLTNGIEVVLGVAPNVSACGVASGTVLGAPLSGKQKAMEPTALLASLDTQQAILEAGDCLKAESVGCSKHHGAAVSDDGQVAVICNMARSEGFAERLLASYLEAKSAVVRERNQQAHRAAIDFSHGGVSPSDARRAMLQVLRQVASGLLVPIRSAFMVDNGKLVDIKFGESTEAIFSALDTGREMAQVPQAVLDGWNKVVEGYVAAFTNGDTETALSAFAEAQELDSGELQAPLWMAYVLTHLGRHSEADEEVARVLALLNNDEQRLLDVLSLFGGSAPGLDVELNSLGAHIKARRKAA